MSSNLARNGLRLTPQDKTMLDGAAGPATALAMRILISTAQILGAEELLDINSAHIDGCLYHGDSGVLFAEKLAVMGAKVKVPTTLNVGALDFLSPGRERMSVVQRAMANRMASAYVRMNCRPTWTCAPYQAGHRPSAGQDVAWGESNAVVFCNSVLGARTNRYGDFLDICAAITGRAPRTGLHLPCNRKATILVDATALPRGFLDDDVAYPILGAWLGRTVGDDIAAFSGLGRPSEDMLKALGASAASSGSVGLFHVIGVTPEAATLDTVFDGKRPARVIMLTLTMLEEARAGLSTVTLMDGDSIGAVAIGSPHLSTDELRNLDRMLAQQVCRIPLYACTSRNTLAQIGTDMTESLKDRGVVIVADTCIVVTPLLPAGKNTLVTNSGKFAFYAPANTGYDVVFTSLHNCIASALAGCLKIQPHRY